MNFDYDVVVIGAGAAGLIAAREVARHRLSVMLVEGRDRVGGRAWTVTSPHGDAAELGAEFIHGSAQETLELLREMGGSVAQIGEESWTYDRSGLQRDESDNFLAAAKLFERARALTSDESVERFLQRFASDPQQNEITVAARAFVEGFEAADPAIAGVYGIADEIRSGTDSASRRPADGYRAMLEYLQKKCVDAGARIACSMTVVRITWSPHRIAIEAHDASGIVRTIRARAAIVTLPIGVLRSAQGVAFDPELPAEKRDALRHIEMGEVVRVSLWFRTPFWEEIENGRYRETAFFRCNGESFAVYWTRFPQRSRVITAWVGGPKAQALRELSQSERIERALEGFGRMLGSPERARREFENAVTHDWNTDPFARGAYSYLAVGGERARATLAAPVEGTLFFAGEATSTDGQGGTVNGALQTGFRAAREVVHSL